MLEKLKRYIPAALIAGVLAVSFVALRYQWARGEVIEGFTPSGAFKTVGLSSAGHLLVDQNAGLSQIVVWVGSPTVTAIQGTSPWIVGFGGTAQPVNFNGVGQPVNATQTTSPWLTQAKAYTTPVTGQVTCGAAQVSVYSASANNLGSIICNDSLTTDIFVGPTGLSASTGHAIHAQQCFSPDSAGGTFQGQVFCITASASITADFWVANP